jgi:putative oxidoreductase
MSMILLIHRCIQIYERLIEFLIKYTYDILLLMVRTYVASIFFQSGWNKLDNLWDGGWFKTVFLFKNVHPVPFLSAEIAAIVGTASEVVFSVLLALGIMARLGALGLLGVTAVITFGVHSHFTHTFWALLLSVSLIIGPGRFSFDEWLRSWWTELHSKVLSHLEAAKIPVARTTPNIVRKENPNRKIMLDNRKDPIVKMRLSKQKLTALPEEIVTVKSLLKSKRERQRNSEKSVGKRTKAT